MIRWHRQLKRRERRAKAALGLRQPALEQKDGRKIALRPEQSDVAWIQRLFVDRDGAFERRLGLGQSAVVAIQCAEIVQRLSGMKVVGPKRLLEDGERTRKERARRRGPSLRTMERS